MGGDAIFFIPRKNVVQLNSKFKELSIKNKVDKHDKT